MKETEARNQQKNENVTVNREHKDRLFKIIFQEKEDLLSLYNAINGTSYDNPEDLTITTMEDVIYISMKNDLSFILDDQLNLYEHQSTVSGNLPIRGAFYLCKQYEQYVQEHELNLFTSVTQRLPFPQFYVFYNGTSSMPDKVELRLSDAFIKNEHTKALTPALECTAILLNINEGCNEKLMNDCRALREYAQFIKLLRENLKKYADKKQAVLDTVDYCIENNILQHRLIREKGKVIDVLLTECDWDYVKKLYEKDFGRMQVEIDRLHSDNEQLALDNQQLNSNNEQLLSTLLEIYRETGFSKEGAIEQIKQKLPNIPLELTKSMATQIFSDES